jgi:hypothetical protein
MLDAEQSAALREQLIADVGRLQSADDAAEWVHRNLPLKNTLLAADADLLEENFRDRLTAIESVSAMLERQLQAAPGEYEFTLPEPPFLDHDENTTGPPTVLRRPGTGSQRRLKAKTIRLRDKNIASSSRLNPALSVAGPRPRGITSALPSRALWAAK